MIFPIKDGFEQYLAIEMAGGASWHPNNEQIVFVYDSPGHIHVYSVGIEEHEKLWPIRLTFDSDRCTNPRYLADGSIVFLTDKSGDENFQIGCFTPDQEINFITSDLKAKHIINVTTDKALYFTANIKDKSVFAIYRHKIPLKDHKSELIFQPTQGVFSVPIVSQDEKFLILTKAYGNNNQELFLLDANNGKIKPLSRHISGNVETRWNAIRWLDSNHLLVLTDHKSNFLRLAIISLKGKFQTLNQIEKNLKFDITSTTWTNKSPYTYFTYNQEGYSILYRGKFSSEWYTDFERINFAEKSVLVSGDARTFTKGMSLSPDGKKLALTLSSPISPTNIWIYNTESKVFWKATQTSTAGLNSKKFVNTTLRKFHSFDSLSIPYFKYTPPTKMPENGFPAMIIIHGGPEAQTRPIFTPMIQYFISAGFSVIAPNIRGSTGYGRIFLDLDNVEKRLDSIRDIKYLVLHIKENDPLIDSSRLAILGGSYGGFAVLSAMTEHPNLWKAGVDIFGIANFITFSENTAPWRRAIREAEYGSLENDQETLIRISPINKVDQITAPLFIIAGDNDERVPVSESIQMHEKLKKRGINVELLRFDDEGHGITKLNNKIKAYSKIVEWLQNTI